MGEDVDGYLGRQGSQRLKDDHKELNVVLPSIVIEVREPNACMRYVPTRISICLL